MILELDVGNTRCKWRLKDEDGSRREGGAVDAVQKLLMHLAEQAVAVSRLRVSNVSGEASEEQITELSLRYFSVTAEFARTAPAWGDVQCAYANYQRLGVDRWLAVCGAWNRIRGPVLVADAGSALTLDVVAANGEHLGGYIVPGARLQRESLFKDTSDVRFDGAGDGEYAVLGCDTAAAVQNGILRQATAFIDAVAGDVSKQQGRAVPVLLTGGDAALLAQGLACEHRVVPELVLDGLSLVLP